MLSEICQMAKHKYIGFKLYVEYIFLKNKLIEADNRLVVTRGKGGWREGKMGKRGQLYGDRWKQLLAVNII